MNKLNALILNCSLKPSNEKSNTDALLQDFIVTFEEKQVETETIRVADYNVAFGVDDDMGNGDEWPIIADKIEQADILLVGTPIWLGEKSSVAKMVMERISGSGAKTNELGQPVYYNKVAGAVVTGNEDGAKHAARDILFSLGHYGFSLPPNPLSYWVGEAGPGPSYIEAEGYKNEFTKNNAQVASYNLVHLAEILANNPIPTEGNVLA
ncbi:flavodoxin family protein [Oceanobacillus arenosus]|uniref:Flavodoxin family protein n=1 Tax=Oceanobacillus arenosus TaxID=1229153 RepID=A0A3D8PQD0_9BACI|nr:flavodoxin family protein [Oceanobacillus arenosus]RDW18356.1 flavodoxin family protein [Oceanobacillus arenosus]